MNLTSQILSDAACSEHCRVGGRKASLARGKARKEREAGQAEWNARKASVDAERRNVDGRDIRVAGGVISSREYYALRTALNVRRVGRAELERANYICIEGRWQDYDGAAECEQNEYLTGTDCPF